MKINKLIIFVCSGLLFLTGCGKDKVDYVTETNTPTDGIATNMSTGTLEEQIGAEDVWEEDIDIAKGKKICAEVVIPDASGMKVVNLERVSFDAEFKESFMNCLTDGPVYKYDYEFLPKEEIEKNIEYYRDAIADAEAQGYDVYDEESEYYYLYSKLQELEEELEVAPEDYVLADDYSGNSFLFTYNDVEYIISFLEWSDNERKIELDIKNPVEIIDEDQYAGVFYGSSGDYTVSSDDNINRCDITEEEAKEVASDFVNQFGLGDFKVVETEMLLIYCNLEDDSLETFLYGYTFKFYRCIDGIEVDGNKYKESKVVNEQFYESQTEDYDLSSKDDCFEEILIYVTDEGVVKMNYSAPFIYKDVVAEDVSLLSFDTVKSVVIEEILAKSYYEYDTMRRMELGYYNYWDNDYDNAVIIPVWKLTTDTNGKCSHRDSYVLINAMDGSVINVGKQHHTVYNLRDAEDVDENTDN